MQCIERMPSRLVFVWNMVYFLASNVHCINSDKTTDTQKGRLQEYCNLETFRPNCMKNEVIVIDEAYYGRRQVGKCIDAQEAADFAHDSRFLGCYADVMASLNARCSGKKQCEIRIADPELETTRTCLKGLHMFLEVSYTCVPVVEDDRSCVVSVTSDPLYIASSSPSGYPSNAGQVHCGTRAQPYVLEAPAGQRVNVSLLDFSLNVGDSRSTPESKLRDLTQSSHMTDRSRKTPGVNVDSSYVHQHRPQYGFIVDKSAEGRAKRKNMTIGGGRKSGVLTNVYLSTANVIEFILVPDGPEDQNEHKHNFLVKFEAVGCTNLVPPEDAWIKRDNDDIVIGCYTTRQTWHLRCEDARWIGVMSNCTQHVEYYVAPTHVEKFVRFGNYQIATVIAIGFMGLSICLTIICCGIVCLRRFYSERFASKVDSSKYKDIVVTTDIDRLPSSEEQRGKYMSPYPAPNSSIQG